MTSTAYEINLTITNDTITVQSEQESITMNNSPTITTIYLPNTIILQNNTIIQECITNNYEHTQYYNNTEINNITYALECPEPPACTVTCPEIDYTNINAAKELTQQVYEQQLNMTTQQATINPYTKKLFSMMLFMITLFSMIIITAIYAPQKKNKETENHTTEHISLSIKK